MGLASSGRTEIYRIAVDASGTPDVIQLPEGRGPYNKITVSVESNMHGWLLYAPTASSSSKTFAAGAEYVFQNGPYHGGDILGYVALDSGSDYLILFCEL